MTTSSVAGGELVDVGAPDPRVDDDFLRVINGPSGDIVLVGVVHNHPASIARVKSVVERMEPDAIGLEIPPVTVPVFESARLDQVDEEEFVAAIHAAPDALIAGIDLPSFAALRILLPGILLKTKSIDTAVSLVRKTIAHATQAIHYRLATSMMGASLDTVTAGSRIEYDCSTDASPTAQAEHERKAVEQSMSFFEAIETPTAVLAYDALRERHMAHRIERLAAYGTVVSVLGVGHLDSVYTMLMTA